MVTEPFSIRRSREVREATDQLVLHAALNNLLDRTYAQPCQLKRSSLWINGTKSLDTHTIDIKDEQCIMYHVIR